MSSRLARISTPTALLVSAALYGLVVVVDIVTPDEFTLSVFYLTPIAIATWRFGLGAGLAFSVAGALMAYGHERWGGVPYSHPIYMYWAMGVRFLSFCVVTWVLAKLRASYAEIEDLARVDPLTGIANRRGFYETSETALRWARRSGTALSLLYLDIDDFKQVNDTDGHPVGDELLRAVAQQLSATRTTDTAARLGGDEFVLLMPDTGADAADEVVARLRDSLAKAVADRWTVTFSMGLVTFLVPPPSPNTLIQRADALMYSVKHGSKNDVRRVVVEGDRTTVLEARAGRQPAPERA